MTFEEFTRSPERMRNSWVLEPGLSLYVRKPTGFTHNANFELASMEAEKPGSGALTSFLDRTENSYTFYIENILNERLASFFKARGYRIIGAAIASLDLCMISRDCWHMKDHALGRHSVDQLPN